jgi:glutamyl-tRNA synthetase
MGYLPQAMVNYLALLGWGDGTENEFFTIDDLGLFLILFFLSFSLQFFNIKLK